MKTLELFCGTKSFSKVMVKKGFSTLTIDNNFKLNPDLCVDLLVWDHGSEKFDIVWASPPCQAFSVASIGRHWGGGFRIYSPKTEFAKLSLELVEKTILDIKKINPKYYFIENPRGVLRKLINPLFEKHGLKPVRHTITYCQYGDNRMKPTDIWTNCLDWVPKPICKNGDSCHVSAPRGSKTGTQGLKGHQERGVIPESLFFEILDSI